MLLVLFVTSLSFCVYYTTINVKFAFYLLPARVWEFAAGGLLALYLLNKDFSINADLRTKCHRLGAALSSLGVFLSILSINFVDRNTLYFQGLWAICPVVGTTALIAGLTLNRTGFWSRFFSLRPLVWLGLLSYSWYLWHWPLLAIQRVYALGGDSLPQRVGMCLVALAAAFISYRFIEQPIRVRKPWLFATTKGSLVAGGLMVLGMIGLAALVVGNKVFLQLNPQHRLYESAKDDVPNRTICDFQSKKYSKLNICGKIATPSAQRPVIVLWGDSHAEHFFSAMVEKYPNHDIHSLTFEECPPITDSASFLFREILRKNYYCATFNQDVINHLLSLGSRLSAVYISARWPMYYGKYPIVNGHAPAPADYPSEKMHEAMQQGMSITFKQLSNLTAKIYVIGAIPPLHQPAPKCLAMNKETICHISYDDTENFVASSFTALSATIKPYPAITLLDLRSYFCDVATCFAAKDGRPLYTDDHHITATTGRELASYLKP